MDVNPVVNPNEDQRTNAGASQQIAASAGGPRKSYTSAVLAIALFAVMGYAAHQSYFLKKVSDENVQAQEQMKKASAQMDQMSAKLDELAAAKAAAAQQAQMTQAKAQSRIRKVQTARSRAADAKLKKIQSQLDEQGNAIASTRDDLSNTRTELQGSIARTHGELVVLQRKGERNYFEFDLDKSGQFRSQGPIGIKLRKANVKHQYADLELLVDDVSLTKKHVNLYEPAAFYATEDEHPIELVINSISKNHIHGYVSAPKYRKGDLAAMTPQATGTESAQPADAAVGVKTRERLGTPR
jgi:hypothetical protein